MKMYKRILSILLTASLIVGSVSFLCFSDDKITSEIKQEKYINQNYDIVELKDESDNIFEEKQPITPIIEKNIQTESDSEPVEKSQDDENSLSEETLLNQNADKIDVQLPNETPKSAPRKAPSTRSETQNIHTLVVGKQVTGTLQSTLSEEIYDFKIEDRGVIRYAFTHQNGDDSECNWNITLYMAYSPDGISNEKQYREIDSLNYTKLGTACFSTYIGVTSGEYRLVIDCVSGYTREPFSLVVGFDNCYTDTKENKRYNFEVESGNEMARYTELPLNREMMGTASRYTDKSITKTDEDWYMFTVGSLGLVEIYFSQLTPDTAGTDSPAWLIRLCDENNKTIYSNSVPVKTALSQSGIIGLKPGNYFVCVSPLIATDSVYTVKASFNADNYVEQEFNDTKADATPLTNKQSASGLLSDRSDGEDIDWFTFTMEKRGYSLIKFQHDKLTRDRNGWRISLFDENDTLIYSDYSKHNSDGTYSPYIGLDKGKYYIKIDSNGLYREDIPYFLTYAGIEDDSWEYGDNSTAENAIPIFDGKQITGTLVALGLNYDTDWYSFDLLEKTSVTVLFSHDDLKEDKEGWIITLLDNDQREIYTAKSGWNDTKKSFTSLDLNAGKYYVKIETGMYFNNSIYHLNVSFK